VKLTDNREVKGILIDEKHSSLVDLNGKILVVGKEGVRFDYSEKQPALRGGYLTSSGGDVIINSKTTGSSQKDEYGMQIFINVHISSVIQDHINHKVGLVMNGSHPLGELGVVSLTGRQENTFTGDVVVEGGRNILYLSKNNGVTAIQRNATVKNGGRLALSNSDQISDTATVTLSGKDSTFSFTGNGLDRSEKIHALVIDSGS